MRKVMLIAAAVVALGGLSACKGSAEKAGENLDSAVEETTQGEKNLNDGAFEKTGEAIDKAANDGKNKDTDAADALSDATDGDKSTKP